MSKVIAGKTPPPLSRLPAWANALDLEGDARRSFFLLAGLAHIPDKEVRELMADELAALRIAIIERDRVIARLEVRMQALEDGRTPPP